MNPPEKEEEGKLSGRFLQWLTDKILSDDPRGGISLVFHANAPVKGDKRSRWFIVLEKTVVANSRSETWLLENPKDYYQYLPLYVYNKRTSQVASWSKSNRNDDKEG